MKKLLLTSACIVSFASYGGNPKLNTIVNSKIINGVVSGIELEFNTSCEKPNRNNIVIYEESTNLTLPEQRFSLNLGCFSEGERIFAIEFDGNYDGNYPLVEKINITPAG